MKKLLVIVLICFVALNSDAQDLNQPRYGITYIQNFAAQINYNPQLPEDGKFQWNTLSAPGFGVFYETYIGKRISVATQGIFQVKGYREFAQFSDGPGLLREEQYSNKFRYATLELNPTYYFPDREGAMEAFLSVGLNANYLLSKRVESSNLYYPASEYHNFKQWSAGYNCAVGFIINNLLIFEGKFQRDLTPILNEENLRIWNRALSLNLKININQIITNTKSLN